jgi:hypothetical protein
MTTTHPQERMTDKLSIAEFGFNDIHDLPMDTKVYLERHSQQGDARIHFARASTDALIAGTLGLSAALAAVSFTPVLLLGAVPALYFVGSSVNEFGKGVLHANNSAQPDSAIQETIQMYERENPQTVIQQPIEHERLAEGPALLR